MDTSTKVACKNFEKKKCFYFGNITDESAFGCPNAMLASIWSISTGMMFNAIFRKNKIIKTVLFNMAVSFSALGTIIPPLVPIVQQHGTIKTLFPLDLTNTTSAEPLFLTLVFRKYDSKFNSCFV